MSDSLRLRADKLRWLDTDGEVVALDEISLMYLGANETGSVLWQELAAGTTVAELVQLLVDRYGVAAEVAKADVERFLAELERRGLLER